MTGLYQYHRGECSQYQCTNYYKYNQYTDQLRQRKRHHHHHSNWWRGSIAIQYWWYHFPGFQYFQQRIARHLYGNSKKMQMAAWPRNRWWWPIQPVLRCSRLPLHAACGSNNGSITATASGGTGALQYSINGTVYQANNVFNAVAAGGYTLYVRCQWLYQDITCNRFKPGRACIDSKFLSASCGLTDSTITASAAGGTRALQYSINGVTFPGKAIFFSTLRRGHVP